MSALHCPPSLDEDEGDGGASSSSIELPHFLTTQSGASRSVSPERARREARFLERRREVRESWYLSRKMKEGRGRWVWSLQASPGGGRGEGKVRRRVGWRPVGWRKEAVYVALVDGCGGWWREGKEKRVGSGGEVSSVGRWRAGEMY